MKTKFIFLLLILVFCPVRSSASITVPIAGEPGYYRMVQWEYYYEHNRSWLAGLYSKAATIRVITSILKEEGLPPELIAVAIVESGLNPYALSLKDAKGYWQFIPGTAKKWGLRVDRRIDQRTHLEASTRAAASYLKFLYWRYQDWPLAIAAYNCGEGNLDRIITRNRRANFWHLTIDLPRETYNFVPQVLAVVKIVTEQMMFQGRPGIGQDVRGQRKQFQRPRINETLSARARRQGVSLASLVRKNSPGQKSAGPSLNQPVRSQKHAQADDSQPSWHYVSGNGATLSLIAQQHNLTLKRLIELNRPIRWPMSAGDSLRVK